MTEAVLSGAVTRRLSPRLTWRLRYLGVCAVLTGFAFNSDAGRTVQDTKLDLVVDPVRFLARSLHLWDPVGAGGQLQEQAYGYLFPMGPFFAVGRLLHLPPWALQRLWWSVVLCTAFLGVVTLAGRLGLGTPLTRLVGGLVFALSPHLLTVLGPVSAEAWPMSLSAWVLVPLVGGSERGSPRRAACWSGLAVLLMGGINAALDLTALLPAVLWLLTRRSGPRSRRLAGWWVAAVACACAWWVVPLLLLGRYSPPFLGYIESAATTTRVTSLTESLRGTGDWVPYLSTTGWHAGWILLTQPAVILNTVVVAAAGLAGLALRRVPHRTWLVLMLLLGVTAMAAGHVAGVDGFAPGPVRSLLDGALAPLRNVHKFDVLVRLPLALGVVVLLDRAARGRTVTERVANRVTATVLAGVAVFGGAAPLVSLKLAPGGTFAEIPSYWRETAGWLDQHDARGRALLLPASRFGTYLWGSTGDEPLQALAASPWEVRSAIPLVPAGHIMALDAVEQRLVAGQPSAGLAPYLQSMGIRYLVVRNDLDYSATGSPRPLLVQQALAGSPGLRLERVFGPQVGGVGDPSLVVDQDLQLYYPAVQIWSVAAEGSQAPADTRVATLPAAQLPVTSGGPATGLELADASLGSAGPGVLTGDGPLATRVAAPLGPGVLSDSLRRRETNFGGAAGVSSSATLAPGDPLTLDNAERDYVLPGGDRHLATARLGGLAALTASSSAADPQAFLDTDQAAQPFSAVDGDPATAWRSSPGAPGIGQWLDLRFTGPTDLAGSTVRLPAASPVTQLTVSTDRGVRTMAVRSGVDLPVVAPPGPTRSVRLTVTGLATGVAGFQAVGIAELSVPGVHPTRTIVLPDDLPAGAAPATIQLSAAPGARPSCLLVSTRALCAQNLGRQGEDVAGLDRTFTTGAAASYDVTAWAAARPGPALDRIIERAVRPAVSAVASSSAVPDPLGGPAAAVDGDFGTGWVADPADPDPTLRLAWTGARTVSSVRLVSDPYLAATRAQSAVVTAGGRTTRGPVEADGTVRFPAVRTTSVTLQLVAGRLTPTYDPTTHTTTSLGVGVSEVLVPGVAATSRSTSDLATVSLPCGSTPSVVVDGRTVPTAATVSVAQLRAEATFPLALCVPGSAELAAGGHRVVMASTAAFGARRLLLTDPARSGPAAAAASAQPGRWDAGRRTVRVGARDQPTVLLVRENANPGWQATIGGEPLPSLTIDGWQQGYLLPAGGAATVDLTFGPDRTYRAGLLVGLVLAVLLAVAAGWPARRLETGPAAASARPGRVVLPVATAVALALVGGWWGLGALLLWPAVTAFVRRGGGRGTRLDRLARTAPAVVAAATFLGSGVVVAWGHWASAHYRADDSTVQVGCLIALATASAGASCWGWADRRRPAPRPVAGSDGPAASAGPAGSAGP